MISTDDAKVIAASAKRIVEAVREQMPVAAGKRQRELYRDVSIEAATILQLIQPCLKQ